MRECEKEDELRERGKRGRCEELGERGKERGKREGAGK